MTSPPRIAWLANDDASRRVLDLAAKVAVTSTTILITGESGCGKDQLARLIHEMSPRRDAPYLKIDCASLPPELLESELFGHEKGAFTGAVERKLGRLEMARGGTIVLDEVTALALAIQSKLLRVIEERTFSRLGGAETLRIEARLIALTNADLERLVAAGRFRDDLYYRLKVFTIAVPPLRRRPADILPLAEELLARLAAVHGRVAIAFHDDARRLLETYSWPGNVRELKNSIERALVLSSDAVLRPEHFPDHIRAAAAAPLDVAALRSLEDVEREAIAATLEATHFKITKSAEILGISRKTLLDKRKKYGLG